MAKNGLAKIGLAACVLSRVLQQTVCTAGLRRKLEDCRSYRSGGICFDVMSTTARHASQWDNQMCKMRGHELRIPRGETLIHLKTRADQTTLRPPPTTCALSGTSPRISSPRVTSRCARVFVRRVGIGVHLYRGYHSPFNSCLRCRREKVSHCPQEFRQLWERRRPWIMCASLVHCLVL